MPILAENLLSRVVLSPPSHAAIAPMCLLTEAAITRELSEILAFPFRAGPCYTTQQRAVA
jgi:hypothetical protein